MERKSIEFKEEIEKAEKDFIQTKETKKSLIKALIDSEEEYKELKRLEECIWNSFWLKLFIFS